jgi:hypothetical protein
VVAVPALPTHVHDLDGLRQVGELLASPNIPAPAVA